MARASTSRSQRAPKASQPRPSQSQRARRGHRGDPEDEGDNAEGVDEGEVADADADADADMEVDDEGDRGGGDGETDILRKANDLVRLALFNEQKRIPLRREEINKKVLGSNTRAFNRVLENAQTILSKTFAMELVELRSRADLEKVANEADNGDDLDDARQATGMKKRAAAAGSKTYILRSTLDPLIIEYAALTDEAILEEEAADAVSDDDDDDMFGSRTYGSIISWSNTDQLGPTGILYVVLALILVSGRVMSDMDLRANLKRLRLPTTGSVAFNARSTHKTLPIDQYLSLLMRQGYIDRQRIGDAKKAKGKGKRGRPTQDDDAGSTYEWRWGNRAQSEVGEMGIAKFVSEFMVGEGEVEDADDEEEGVAAARARAKKRQADAQNKLGKMMKGIERAAGGALAELK